MKFIIEDKIFEALPNLCIGVVVAKGVDNHKSYPKIDSLLDQAIKQAEKRFAGKKVKEEPEIIPYREGFQAIGLNPNKFMCSVEALFTRIAKGKGMPHINPLVDLNNAISLSNTLPMGTHDLSLSDKDIMLRYTKSTDIFVPFGSDTEEHTDEGEVAYAVGDQIRTRHWAWRQSEYGKINEDTNFVFFPIDGFIGFNDDKVKAATDELEKLLHDIFKCQTKKGFVDKDHPSMLID